MKRLKKIFALFITFAMSVSLIGSRAGVQAEDRKIRDVILMIDVSDGMADTPLIEAKNAAILFCDKLFADETSNSQVAVIAYSDNTYVSTFSSNQADIKEFIDPLASAGISNLNGALLKAGEILQSGARDGSLKSIVIMTGVMPDYGLSGNDADGKYPGNGYASEAYNTAWSVLADYDRYTLGFFHNLSSSEKDSSAQFLKDIQSKGYYEVADAKELDFQFAPIASDIINSSGTFYYPGAKGRDYPATYYYSDSYFSESSYIYNNHLATMSLCLDLSAWNSNEVPNTPEGYKQKSKNAEKLLTDIGFSGFAVNDGFQKKPTQDSIGVAAACKKITADGKDYTLVAVAIRGGGYESEWASNFTLGYGTGYSDTDKGYHKGFYEARDQTLSFVKQYLEDNVEGDVKLWIVGYSRAGAVAGLAAAWIDDNYSSFADSAISILPENVYAYTFAAPQATVFDEAKDQNWAPKALYRNIHNTINYADPVPKVAMSAWSFVRYGVDYSLPTSETDENYSAKKEKMLVQLNSLANQVDYSVDSFEMKKIVLNPVKILPGGYPFIEIAADLKNKKSQSAFLDEYITRLATEGNLIGNREKYAQKYEENIREICKIFFGADDTQTEMMIEIAAEKFKNNWCDIIKPLYCNSLFKSAKQREKESYKIVAKFLSESLDKADITYEQAKFDAAVVSISDLLVATALNYPNLAVTLGTNMDTLGTVHAPEICLAWLMSFDGYYTGEDATQEFFAYPAYRIIRINSPVDAEVFDANGTKVAEIINDEPQEIAGSSIITALSENEKLIYLPASHEYSIRLKAISDGSIALAVNEFSYESGKISRAINFSDITLNTGEVFEAGIPAVGEAHIGNGSSAEYTLCDENDIVSVSEDIQGNELKDSYYAIEVLTEDESKGVTLGGGLYLKGNSALAAAVPNQGYVFDGWYDGDTRISADAEHNVIVKSDEKLTARFVADEPYVDPAQPPVDPAPFAASPPDHANPGSIDSSTSMFYLILLVFSLLAMCACYYKLDKQSSAGKY